MGTLIQSGKIVCGDHFLKAKVTFTEYRYEKRIDGHIHTLAEAPEVSIKCLTCGRETTTDQFCFNTETLERIFP